MSVPLRLWGIVFKIIYGVKKVHRFQVCPMVCTFGVRHFGSYGERSTDGGGVQITGA